MSHGLPSFFRSPKNRSFNYKPMHYSEEKERKRELEQLVEEHKRGQITDERRAALLRSKLNKHWNSRKQQNSGRQFRLLFILAALGGVVWLFFNWI